jgi:molecular chaperone DnaK (HSP70)
MSSSNFIVGIDLGTTNSAVATVEPSSRTRKVEILPIEQVVASGEHAQRALLPSSLYLPSPHELTPGALKLPWGEPEFAVGLFAREQGARVPSRVVTSAKSWLSHAAVDRTAPILPWGAPAEVPRVSPVEASARYLAHMKAAWGLVHGGQSLADQEVVLTVPASFDEVARELTVEAARLAGLGHVTLLEEPLAAFYHWLEGHQAKLTESLAGVSLVLVVDVGGGTTDLTLIQASEAEDGLRLDRIAVGDHLLLGGDNVDLAIAALAEKSLGGGKLDATEWGALVASARSAKEALLSADAPETRSVAVLGRSSKLLGGAKKTEVTRDEVRSLVLDGFFPNVPVSARPERRVGLKELGLPYASDAAITKHIAAFLARHLSPGQKIDALLFNGGALTPAIVQDRIVEVLGGWFGQKPKVLVNDSLDLAVARGASYFGLVRRGEGVRVGGGSPRAYFLGVQTPQGHQAVCLIPKGLPEGSTVPLSEREFVLTTGKPVRFELLSSTGRKLARPGDLIAVEGADDLLRLPPIQTVVRAPGGAGELKVQIVAGVTEIGTLALFCVAGEDRFKLEFQLRGEAGEAGISETGALPKRFTEAKELIEKFYGKKPAQDVDPREVKNLQRSLEKVLGERQTWTLPSLRELWSTLWAGAGKRRRTADHERAWLMLAGYSLRPGFGAPLDDWRSSEMFTLFSQGLQFHQEKPAWDQWWIMWRRIAGGLNEQAQTAIVEAIRPYLEPVTPGKTKPKPKGPKFEGTEEMIRLVASLERLAPALKLEVANWLWARIGTPAAGGSSYWVFGRIGARAPFYGSAHQVVAPEVAEEWLEKLLKLDWKSAEGAAFAATLIARATGDRARDVSDEIRTRVIERLEKSKAAPSWIAMVREPIALGMAEEQKIFGDTLPVGLKLVG